ncbi:CDP-alcohol phosphatidyltransferase family protein [Microbispora corallina]|uniref:CDP-alcohol phosphatidyltransferase family protein n=1 Tax=Microbispora corallina TaxID=83302 RepID=UPI0023B3485B|nr:CDP-alcohol phosphatidyltransferase family protein [Microbispora corallina]
MRETDTVAVVLATSPAAGLPCAGGTLLERLTAQLVTLPVREVHVVTRGDASPGGYGAWPDGPPGRAPGLPTVDGMRHLAATSDGLAEDLRIVAKVARAATSPVAVLAADVVAHTEALAGLLEHPSRPTGAVVGNGDPSPLRPPVRTEWGRVVSAGNSFHEVEWPNGTFRGVLQVGEAHLAGFADVAEELADLAQRRRLGRVSDAEVTDLLLTGLVRAGVPVHAVSLRSLHCSRVAGQAAAEEAVAELARVDEPEARLDAAIKTGDGLFATFCVSSWSRHVVRLAARLNLTPNAVTGVSVGLAAIAAIWFSDGHRPAMLVGAAALYLSFVLDCVDGQLARYTRAFSQLGGWLDAMCDRLKEYVVYAGLAAGAAAAGPHDVWPLAVATMLLQTIRHMVDFSYAGQVAEARATAAATGPPRPLGVPWDAASAPASGGGSGAGAVLALSRRLDRGAAYWVKKTIVLPIGERMALIAVTAALFDARVTFVALLSWGLVALVYTAAGRIARSFA